MESESENEIVGQLISYQSDQLDPDTSETHIGLDPILGLTDMDSHKITEDNWEFIKAARRDSVISLTVSPAITINELIPAISEIHQLGGYQKVIVLVDK